MKKIIVMLRVSTDSQDLTDQRKEMYEFIRANGYTEEEVEEVEGVGASAVKLNAKYRDMIARIKELIETVPTIEAVAVWHINRLGRNDSVLIELKNYFIQHKIQLLCKNPSIRLLNDDKTVNAGTELAFSLFATMAKQEDEERKEKFHRAKRANAEKCKFNGGWCCKFGYKQDENGFEVPDEEAVAYITQIYELYATGKYSYWSLYKECVDRDLRRPDGTIASHSALDRILSDTAYIGWSDSESNHSHRKYIPIINKELWDKVAEVRKNNDREISKGKSYALGTKVLVCPDCGGYLHIDGLCYVCYRHNKRSKPAIDGNQCPNDLCMNKNVADGILWNMAKGFYQGEISNLDEAKIKEYEGMKGVQLQKIGTLKKKIAGVENKKKKIIDTYLEDLITKQERDKRLAGVDSEVSGYRTALLDLEAGLRRIESVIQGARDSMNNMDVMARKLKEADNIRDFELKKELVHKYISKAVPSKYVYGTLDRRNQRGWNTVKLTVTSYMGNVYEYLFFPKTGEIKVMYDGEWVEYVSE